MIQQKQILIVEDNEINRSMLREILSDEYEIWEAENGQAALDILKQKKNSIMLILLDVQMPVMDGYTFLNIMQKDEQLSLIPVIVMTQDSSEEDELSALTHGATDFLPKPYRPKVILRRVANLIKLRETAAMVNQLQYDELTGLYTRKCFYRKARERLDENPDKEYMILCTNLENFKLFNDTFGRKAGDQLLLDSAEIFQKRVGQDSICCRYNGSTAHTGFIRVNTSFYAPGYDRAQNTIPTMILSTPKVSSYTDTNELICTPGSSNLGPRNAAKANSMT